MMSMPGHDLGKLDIIHINIHTHAWVYVFHVQEQQGEKIRLNKTQVQANVVSSGPLPSIWRDTSPQHPLSLSKDTLTTEAPNTWWTHMARGTLAQCWQEAGDRTKKRCFCVWVLDVLRLAYRVENVLPSSGSSFTRQDEASITLYFVYHL